MEIRSYLDTNLYISFLLNPESPAPPASIVRAGLAGAFTILFGDPTIAEIKDKTINKPYLSGRITQHQVDGLLAAMGSTGEHRRLSPQSVEIERMTISSRTHKPDAQHTSRLVTAICSKSKITLDSGF